MQARNRPKHFDKLRPESGPKPGPHEKPGPKNDSGKTGILFRNSIFKLIVFLTRALFQT